MAHLSKDHESSNLSENFTCISINSKKNPRSTMAHFQHKDRLNIEWLWSPSLDYCRMLPHSGESRQVNDLQNIHLHKPKHTHVYKLKHNFPLLRECKSTRMIISQDCNSEKLAKCDDKGTYHSDWFNFDPSLNGLDVPTNHFCTQFVSSTFKTWLTGYLLLYLKLSTAVQMEHVNTPRSLMQNHLLTFLDNINN